MKPKKPRGNPYRHGMRACEVPHRLASLLNDTSEDTQLKPEKSVKLE